MAANPTQSNNTTSNSNQPGDAFLNFYFEKPEQKKDKKVGLSIAKKIYQNNYNDDGLNFFKGRVARWSSISKWAMGMQDLTEFIDFMNVSDANKAWSRIDMTQTRIGPQFVATLVQSMAKNKLYPFVRAVDNGSVSEKEKRQLDALFRMREVQNIQKLQQASGVQLEPANVYVPDDELSAKVYFELEDRLPKEVRFQKMMAAALEDCQFDKVASRKSLWNLIVLNCDATRIERCGENEYKIKVCVPGSLVYNFFLNDSGEQELGYIGEIYNLKVRDLRRMYGQSKENPNGYTEEQLFNLARVNANRKNPANFSWRWNVNWNYDLVRPYDELSIQVFDFEINCGDFDYYTIKKDSYGKEKIKIKSGIPENTSEGTTAIRKEKNTWWRGVYVPDADEMLYWGAPDVPISPYQDVYKSLCSYSINIPMNNGEYVPSLFERIMEPLKEYQLVKMTRKKLIAKIRPTGIRVDVESARNIDLGGGNSIAWEEIVRIFDQTGNELWSSRGLNPNQREMPALSNTAMDNTVQKIMELTNVLNGIIMEIRSLIGVSFYRDGSNVGDRTPAKLAEQQASSSYNVTDYIMEGHLQLWEETLNKLCILNWNKVVNDDAESSTDLINTQFHVKVKMKMTDYERDLLEKNIAQWTATPDANGQPLISPKDAMRLRNIEDYTLAEMYLANVVEENKKKAEADKQNRENANLMSQRQTAQDAAAAQKQLQDQKIKSESDLKILEAKETKEQILLEKILDIYKTVLTPQKDAMGNAITPTTLPPNLESLANMVFENVAIPLLDENKQMKNQVVQDAVKENLQQQMVQQQMQQQPEIAAAPQNEMQPA